MISRVTGISTSTTEDNNVDPSTIGCVNGGNSSSATITDDEGVATSVKTWAFSEVALSSTTDDDG